MLQNCNIYFGKTACIFKMNVVKYRWISGSVCFEKNEGKAHKGSGIDGSDLHRNGCCYSWDMRGGVLYRV